MNRFTPELTRLAEKVKPGRRKKLKEPRELLEWIRAQAPVPGKDWDAAILVAVRPGEEIPTHTHLEHTLVYYADPLGVPIIVNGNPFYPQAGDVVYLPPQTPHSVPRNTGDRVRVSIGMLIQE